MSTTRPSTRGPARARVVEAETAVTLSSAARRMAEVVDFAPSGGVAVSGPGLGIRS